MEETILQRKILIGAKRIVVKVGTNVLVAKDGHPKRQRIAHIASQIAELHKQGKEIVLVSSGAIGSGIRALNMKTRPKALADLQLAAAVGQTHLLQCYYTNFQKYHCQISQVLLTHADLKHRERHLNARNTMLNLIKHRIIPIVNENDVVAVDEIRLGDNDILSALTSSLIDADLLIMLTTPDGLRRPSSKGRTQRVAFLDHINSQTFQLTFGKQNSLSTGGMTTKLQAAKIANDLGTKVVIACGHKRNIICDVVEGKDTGTLINIKKDLKILRKRKRWINYFHKPQGSLIIDNGATKAIAINNKSLLPAGITQINGKFPIGSQVQILSSEGKLIGHGLVEYSSEQIEKIKGAKSSEIIKLLGTKGQDAIIHRDNLVICEDLIR